MIRNKKGVGNQVFAIVIIMALLLVMLVIYWAFSMFAPSFVSLSNQVTGTLTNVAGNQSDGNLTRAINVPTEAVQTSVNMFEWISYVFFFFMVMSGVFMCFYVRTYPFLLAFWIGGIVLLVIISLFFASAYQNISSSDSFVGEASRDFVSNNFIMNNLPTIIAGWGILCGIIMFTLISREPEAEGVTL